MQNKQLKYRHLLYISSLSVQSCPVSVILRGLKPLQRDVTGDRGCVGPGTTQPGTTLPPFSFEGRSATSRGRKQSVPYSSMFRGMSRSGPSPDTTVGRPGGRPQPERTHVKGYHSSSETPLGLVGPPPGIFGVLRRWGLCLLRFVCSLSSCWGVVHSLQQREQSQGFTRLQTSCRVRAALYLF